MSTYPPPLPNTLHLDPVVRLSDDELLKPPEGSKTLHLSLPLP